MRDVPAIAAWSVAYALVEVIAKLTRRVPTITEMSRGRWWQQALVFGWFAALLYHFLVSRRRP